MNLVTGSPVTEFVKGANGKLVAVKSEAGEFPADLAVVAEAF